MSTSPNSSGTLTHLRDAVLHNLLAGQVRLVANKELVNTLGRIAVDLLEPLLDIREGICVILGLEIIHNWIRVAYTVIGDVVDNNDTVRATVVRRGDSAETFLTCSKSVSCSV